MNTRTPRESFDHVVKAVSERLAPLGYTRRGTTLRTVASGLCGILDFQRSTSSSQDKLLFTVNVGIACGDLLGSSPSQLPKAKLTDAHVRVRLGMLLPTCSDKWWELTASTDSEALAREVGDLILGEAEPYIRRHLPVESLIALWESGRSPGLTKGQCLELLTALKARRQGSGA
jgi:hypothetical protein